MLRIWFIFSALLIAISISTVLLDFPHAFAQMESLKIDGPKNPLLKSTFTLKITVEGTSRASYGDFSSTLFLINKETGAELDAIPVYLLTGENSIPVNLKALASAGKVQAGKYYIAKVQHTNIISEFEFTPVNTIEETKVDNVETPIEGLFLTIDGEKNPRIDTDYNYRIKLKEDPGDKRGLEIFLATEYGDILIDSWKFSKYDKDLVHDTLLDMSKFQWNTDLEYKIIAKIGDKVQVFSIFPQSIDIEKGIAVSKKGVYVKGVLDKPTPNNWIAWVEFCAGAEGAVRQPQFQITTDLESVQFEFDKLVSLGSCGDQLVDVKAKDPKSIQISFIEHEQESSNTDSVDSLKKEISSLKEEIKKKDEELKKKDAVLMEQLKVIQNLASMMKKVFFDSFLTYFQIV